jgi:hypothetical protein
MALNQIDADSNQNFLPAKLPTLPVDVTVLSFQDRGIDCQFNDKIMYIRDQDAHVSLRHGGVQGYSVRVRVLLCRALC